MLLLTFKQYTPKIEAWRSWYAWYPVLIKEGLVWCEYLEYRGLFDHEGFICWEYRRKKNEVAKE